ncbi:MAG TPA: esterase, partial [Actinomycetes bacterium]|nr:esterase [Actinomycetes bacterium]
QESSFPPYPRITRFVAGVRRWRPGGGTPVPTVLTCGVVEENLANNRVMAAALAAQGHPARLVLGRDAHNWVAWRDTFDPWLVGLLQELWA